MELMKTINELRRQDKWVPKIFSAIEITPKVSLYEDLRFSKYAP